MSCGFLALEATSAEAATNLSVSTVNDTSASGGACGNTAITTAPFPLSLREATCLANNIGGEVTIAVPAGTYKLDNGELAPGTKTGQVVNITGAGAASTILDAQGKSRVIGIDNGLVGAVNSTISNLTVTGGATDQFGGAGIIAGSEGTGTRDELKLVSVIVRNNVSNAGKPQALNQQAGGVAMDGGILVVENSVFKENSSGSSPGAGLFYLNQGGPSNQKLIVRGSTFEKNKVTNVTEFPSGGGGLAVEAQAGEVEITGSSFIGNEVTSSYVSTKPETAGFGRINGAGLLLRGIPAAAVSSSTFTGNKLVASGTAPVSGAAVAVLGAGDGTHAANATLHYSRISGNVPAGSAVAQVEGTLNATENWWGCNEGPTKPGCDATAGTVPVTPRLVFSAAASPTTLIGPNASSTLSAGFLTDSANTAVLPSNLGAFSGANVTWSDPQPSPATINGKASPQTSQTAIAAGKATATYNSTSSAGAGHAVATFDNQPLTVTLTVDRTPEVTTNPSDQQVTPGATASFSAAATGTPTPTVQWQRDTGSGTFENIAGATSTTYSFTAQSSETGYRFRAVFTNTIEGTPHSTPTTAATLLVGKATPTLTSTAGNATIGGKIGDTANLSGGSSPTQTITFTAFSPGDTGCTGAPAYSKAVAVSGNGTYQSGEFTPLTAGAYRWVVTYAGDSLNNEVTAACGSTGETSTVAKAMPTLATTATNATSGGEVHDTATLSGGFSPGASITFQVFAPGDTGCVSAVFTKTVTVTGNGSYESTNFKPTEAGAYRWVATYAGDANNGGTAGACGATGETSTIAKATPTISTTATATTLGGKIHDTATLAGGVSAGGSIAFKVYAPGDTTCANALTTLTATVAGNGSYVSGDFTPTEAGDYRWIATYSGDGNNVGTAGACGAIGEISTVGKVSPSLGTAASTTALGGEIHDTATLSGGQSATGSITFKVYAPEDTNCTATLATLTTTVAGDGSYGSGSFKPTEAGGYHWIASYSGDAKNNGAAGSCGDTGETSAVAKASPTIATVATNGTAGGTIHDTATISGGVGPVGIITFDVYAPGDVNCGSPVSSTSVAANGNGSYQSAAYKPAEAGDYHWTASYSGDGNNEGAAGSCGDTGETSTVAKALPTLATAATNGTAGGEIHDTGTLSGGSGAGGSITFKVYAPGDTTCATALATLTATVAGDGSYGSGSFTPTEAGTYRWVASYSGDANNQGTGGTCGDAGETSTVGKAVPTLGTSATDAVVGNPIHDTATVGGGVSPGGAIVFEAFAPGDTTCANPVFMESVSVAGNGSYNSPAYTPVLSGSYHWIATYSGDANNQGNGGTCGEAGETSTVAKATPSISTTATNTALGGPFHDTATLSGGYTAGGMITFNLYDAADASCATPIFTETVAVAGNGSYASTSYISSQVGEYRWVATYSGDANNEGATGACGDAGETSSVGKAAPTISTSATDTTVGGEVHDSATMTGGQAASGSISFEAFGPADPTCTGTPVATSSVTVSGDGSYQSDPYTAEEAGEYHWVASYSGDSGNLAVESSCGDPGETSAVAKASPTIASAASDATLGGAVHATATLAGSHAAGGTITFKAFGPADAACTGAPAFTDTIAVSGSGAYGSHPFTPSQVGAYRWTATYAGDVNNAGATSACGETGATSTVSPPPVVPSGPPPTNVCTPAATGAGPYTPTKQTKGHLVPGVRVRIHVAEPSLLEVKTILHFRHGGKARSVDLGTTGLENPGTRNVRLALPTSLREALPLGTKVRLALKISATPDANCTASRQTNLTVHTKVVRILVAG